MRGDRCHELHEPAYAQHEASSRRVRDALDAAGRVEGARKQSPSCCSPTATCASNLGADKWALVSRPPTEHTAQLDATRIAIDTNAVTARNEFVLLVESAGTRERFALRTRVRAPRIAAVLALSISPAPNTPLTCFCRPEMVKMQIVSYRYFEF